MATDTRRRIMLAAKELAQENETVQGVTVSLESVARRAGLTKPGLMYHYATKEALMFGLVEDAALRWADLLRASAGAGPAELSAFDRHRAYVTAATTAEVSRADHWIFSDALYQPALAEAWRSHLGPWFATGALAPHVRSLLTAARFCADGAWTAEATGVFPADDLDAVRGHALRLIEEAETLEVLS